MKATQTKKPQLYIVRFYEEFLYHTKPKFNYYNEYAEEHYSHSGCTKLLWELRFNSKEKLREQLKKWYPDQKHLFFHTHLNGLFKNKDFRNHREHHLIISTPYEPERNSFSFNFKKVKQTGHKRKKRYYYDDMWNSDDKYTKRLIRERDFNTFHNY